MIFKLLNYRYVGFICLLAVLVYFSLSMFGKEKQSYLPGKTSSGHHQIELACDLCHTPLGGVKQEVCLDCHGEALKQASDSHATKIFNDPRSYAMLDKIDAKRCVTCHAEHRDDQSGGKVATVPTDFCFACHDDIERERPSHEGFAPDGCAASGCHNYHDNKSLYEDFVEKHLEEQPILDVALVPQRNFLEIYRKQAPVSIKALAKSDQDAIVQVESELIINQWAESAHASSGVNCSHCHQANKMTNTALMSNWENEPAIEVCKQCHKKESKHFYQGKHGMRIAAGLSPMKPEMARAAMKSLEHDKELTCNLCHQAHDYNTKKAAVEVCLGCHNDTHSKAYKESPHYRLWKQEVEGNAPVGSGVSCATCHMPRLVQKEHGLNRVLVDHNQNANLRPNSKMIRNVCMQCHGLAFTLESLANINLVFNNYSGSGLKKHKTIEMVRERSAK